MLFLIAASKFFESQFVIVLGGEVGKWQPIMRFLIPKCLKCTMEKITNQLVKLFKPIVSLLASMSTVPVDVHDSSKSFYIFFVY